MEAIDSAVDPSGPPQPVKCEGSPGLGGPRAGGAIGEILVVLAECVVAGGLVVNIGGSCILGATSGATRSAQMKWQQRADEIERAVAESPRLEPGAAAVANGGPDVPGGGQAHVR